jgi:NAD(P)-dependent dehydrogenase (short-subunit alcohol dehydrogenase family)
MKDFHAKTAFITGGASGIGFGMARAFGRAGTNVVIADIEEAAGKKAVEQLASEQVKARYVHCDVAERASVREAALEAIAAFGKIHVVCNNAGVGGPPGQLGLAKPGEWDWVIDVNLMGVVYGMETFVPLIRSHGEGGHIVNTASLAGLISSAMLVPYSATKHAVVSMSEGWQIQLTPENIGVSVLCPGVIRTNIMTSARNRQARYSEGRGPADQAFGLTEAAANSFLALGIDADIVGNMVVEFVKKDALYIITDPRFRPFIERRFAGIREALDEADKSEALKAVKTWPPMPGA